MEETLWAWGLNCFSLVKPLQSHSLMSSPIDTSFIALSLSKHTHSKCAQLSTDGHQCNYAKMLYFYDIIMSVIEAIVHHTIDQI